MPDLALEREAGGEAAGIDEAGRGPWAGPVMAAAVILRPELLPPAVLARIDDSKKLARNVREEIVAELARACGIGIGAASAREIDRIGIHRATLAAMKRAFARLPIRPRFVLVDGRFAPDLPCRVRTVVGGDGLSLSIAAASVVAKVARDRLMARLALRYPGYGFERNMGYGTEGHRRALAELGPTPHHRFSFAPLNNMLSPVALQT